MKAFIAIIYIMIGVGSSFSIASEVSSDSPIRLAAGAVALWPITFGVSISESIHADREAVRLYREIADQLKGSE
jgi:hypothetical protein